MIRNTKIVATLGPASETEETIAALLEAGVNVARLNFSHGNHDFHAALIARIRRVSARLGRPMAILQDLQGPKVRVGTFKDGQPVELVRGATFTITTRPVEGNQEMVSTSYANLAWDLEQGDTILLDDGNLELEVEEVTDTDVITKVIIGGFLKEKKGINLPGAQLSIPALTPKDRDDLAFGLEQGVDYIALSFVQRAADVMSLRRAMSRLNPSRANTPIISKLEKPLALESPNLEEIMDASDGIMVARGDLGVELSPQRVPSVQKAVIQAANERGKLVITATQMLESMVNNPRPTRAEASDVANAIFDGTDAVMLSAETAAGKYPVQAVAMMVKIAEEAEMNLAEWGHHKETQDPTSVNPVALARAARELSNNLAVDAVAVFTRTGSTARLVSKERPPVPILAFTPVPETYSRMALMWGVTPHLVPVATSLEEMLIEVEQTLMRRSGLLEGQQVVIVAGMPVARMGPANVVILHTIGQSARYMLGMR